LQAPELGAVRRYKDLDALLREEPRLDIVNICTPNHCHAPQSLTVLKARKHVVIEKPMALRRADCEQVLHQALQVSRQVFCVMQNRYSPVNQWVRQVLAEERLGDIHLVQINCFWNRDDRYYRPGGVPHPWHGKKNLDGGVLFTQFAHFVDILFWLFGDVSNIRGLARNLAHRESTDFADTGTVLFDLASGGIGSMTYTTAVWDRNYESSLLIVGSKGTIKIGGQYMNRLDYCHVNEMEVPVLDADAGPNRYAGYQGSAAHHQQVIANVIEVLKQKEVVTTNALEGLKVVDIIERMQNASSGS
jgi:predicted dehydrogenase